MANKEVQTRIAQFQDDLNKVIKSSVWYENGKSYGWQDTVIEKYYGNFKKDIAELSYKERKMLLDKDVIDKLNNDRTYRTRKTGRTDKTDTRSPTVNEEIRARRLGTRPRQSF